EVRREWAPVLALGFLTEGHRRTLAQAAVQYLLGVPGVVGVVVPLTDPAAAVAIGGALSAPPLSDEDRARIDGARSRVDGSRRTSRDPAPK
ncbi:MAG: hypothetical protein L3J73_05435, partial [Thermoplasmata archaeon]|nr:hypothetical protein [Thermoplasmata archaeon]